MAKRSKHAQPTATARTRAEPPIFHVDTMPDPDAHLTEEQKKWPVVTELLPCEPAGSAPPAAQPSEPQPQTPPAA